MCADKATMLVNWRRRSQHIAGEGDEEESVESKLKDVEPAPVHGPLLQDDCQAHRVLEEINLLFLCHDHHRMVVDVNNIFLLIVPVQDLVLFVFVVEIHSALFALWLLNPISMRVFYEVVVHSDDLLDLTHLIILIFWDDLGDTALVQKLFGQQSCKM